jgi:hypothetical protein
LGRWARETLAGPCVLSVQRRASGLYWQFVRADGNGDFARHDIGTVQVGFDARCDPRAVRFVDGASKAWGQGQACKALRFGHGSRAGQMWRLEGGWGCEDCTELKLEISCSGVRVLEGWQARGSFAGLV